ncbi:MAG: hypothetical protein M0Z53_07325 [Thermaerobacter sp.]|nr:hypothetical protein [Thermaerobacter sp.]
MVTRISGLAAFGLALGTYLSPLGAWLRTGLELVLAIVALLLLSAKGV